VIKRYIDVCGGVIAGHAWKPAVAGNEHHAYYWSASRATPEFSWCLTITDSDTAEPDRAYSPLLGFQVRCVK
jgi:hypothetical protein